MAIEVKRKKGETFESFLRRFNKRLIQSKVILEFKGRAHEQKKHSRNKQNLLAVERKKYREKLEFMKKTGRLVEDKKKTKRR
jgi:hypothetical protein